MYYFFKTTDYTGVSFDFSKEGRRVLIMDEDIRIASIATYLLYYNPNYTPPVLPPIEIIANPKMNRDECMPNGIMADYLSIGAYYFISQRLKDCFDRFQVDGFYSDAFVSIDGVEYPTPYFIFSPKLAIDAIDRSKSIYTEEPEDSEAIRISCIEKLTIDDKKIPMNTPLFHLAGNSQRIYLMHSNLADELEKMNIVGMVIKPIEEGKWMY